MKKLMCFLPLVAILTTNVFACAGGGTKAHWTVNGQLDEVAIPATAGCYVVITSLHFKAINQGGTATSVPGTYVCGQTGCTVGPNLYNVLTAFSNVNMSVDRVDDENLILPSTLGGGLFVGAGGDNLTGHDMLVSVTWKVSANPY